MKTPRLLLLALCLAACTVHPRPTETGAPSRLSARERVLEDSLSVKIGRAARREWPD